MGAGRSQHEPLESRGSSQSHGTFADWTRKQAQWLDGVRNVRGHPDSEAIPDKQWF